MIVAVPFRPVARLLAAALAGLALCGAADAAAPVVQARAYVVQSSVDGHTLAAREATTPRAMASITKLMTALVALQHVSLDDVVTVPVSAAAIGESSLEKIRALPETGEAAGTRLLWLSEGFGSGWSAYGLDPSRTPLSRSPNTRPEQISRSTRRWRAAK